MYRNSEGYPDPTAGEAMANILRERKRELRNMERYGGKDKNVMSSGDSRQAHKSSMETCFAYMPEGMLRDRINCGALAGRCPGFGKCNFYRGITEHRESLKKAYSLMRHKPRKVQYKTSRKYYSGTMPWLEEDL